MFDNVFKKRRGCPYMTEEDVERVAEMAANKAVNKMATEAYQAIGKGVVNRFLWIVGVITVGFAAWLHSKGVI